MKSFPRTTLWLGLLALSAASFLPACGDSGSGSGGGGAGGAGAAGGGGSTTGTETAGGGGSGGTTSAGGSGGSGGSTSSGGSGGGTTTAMGKPDGEPCTGNDECANGFCLTQLEFGFPYGSCSGPCNSFIPCTDGSACGLYNNEPFCFKACTDSAQCGVGRVCDDIGDGTTLCVPGCTMDSECLPYGTCDAGASGYCLPFENCDKQGDEDHNGYTDCEDTTCAMKCKPQIDMTCTAAEPVSVVSGTQTVVMGDNSSGTRIFYGSCSGQGNSEKIYKITAPANQGGVLHVTLSSSDDLLLYARKDCATLGELACTDGKGPGEDEMLHIVIGKGESVFVFVDGSSIFGSTDNQGPYALAVDLEVQTCGDGVITGSEQCDDGGVVAGDGCNAMCNAEPKTEVEPANNLKATATVVAGTAALYTGKLAPGATDEDWYQVSVTAGKTAIAAQTLPAGADTCALVGKIDTLVNIYDAVAMDPIASNDDISPSPDPAFANYCSAVTAEALPEGIYYVQVRRTIECDPAVAGDCKDFDYGLLVQVK